MPFLKNVMTYFKFIFSSDAIQYRCLMNKEKERILFSFIRAYNEKQADSVYADYLAENKTYEDKMNYFVNYIEKYGENYYQTVEGARERNGEYQVVAGYLEMSNIKVVSEMVEMISVSRAYETNQKLIQTYDSSLEIAANQIGKI